MMYIDDIYYVSVCPVFYRPRTLLEISDLYVTFTCYPLDPYLLSSISINKFNLSVNQSVNQ